MVTSSGRSILPARVQFIKLPPEVPRWWSCWREGNTWKYPPCCLAAVREWRPGNAVVFYTLLSHLYLRGGV